MGFSCCCCCPAAAAALPCCCPAVLRPCCCPAVLLPCCCPALPRPALPCPALPRPALPCPALPCPAAALLLPWCCPAAPTRGGSTLPVPATLLGRLVELARARVPLRCAPCFWPASCFLLGRRIGWLPQRARRALSPPLPSPWSHLLLRAMSMLECTPPLPPPPLLLVPVAALRVVFSCCCLRFLCRFGCSSCALSPPLPSLRTCMLTLPPPATLPMQLVELALPVWCSRFACCGCCTSSCCCGGLSRIDLLRVLRSLSPPPLVLLPVEAECSGSTGVPLGVTPWAPAETGVMVFCGHFRKNNNWPCWFATTEHPRLVHTVEVMLRMGMPPTPWPLSGTYVKMLLSLMVN